MNTNQRFKPEKAPFILFGVMRRMAIVLIILVLFYLVYKIIFPESSPALGFALVFVVCSLTLYGLRVVTYNKTFYTILEDRIVQQTGGLFHNSETELKLKNTTHLIKRLPWLENKIFRTGEVVVEAAGASTAEVHIYSRQDYQVIHHRISDLLKQNGFRLKKDKLITTEKPHPLGVFFEVFKSIIVTLMVIVWFGSELMEAEAIRDLIISNLIPFAVFIISALLVFNVFRFLNLYKRKYNVFGSLIEYREGFLTKNYVTMPFENLTDSSVTQTLVDKLFGLYDVRLSCQGSSHEVHFKNMKHGKEMSDKLDELIDAKTLGDTGPEAKQAKAKSAAESTDGQVLVSQPRGERIDEKVDYDTGYTGSFKMNMARAIFGTSMLYLFGIILVGAIVLFSLWVSPLNILRDEDMSEVFSMFVTTPIILAVVFHLVFLYVRYRFTNYYIRKQSVSAHYNFLNRDDVSFGNDNVTGVIVSRSFLDDWFGTVNVKFWSIGAIKSLRFQYIKNDQIDIDKLVAKFGIRKEQELMSIDPEFSFAENFKANIYGILVLALLFFGGGFALSFISIFASVMVIVAGLVIYILYFLYTREIYKRTKLSFDKRFIYLQKGWLFKSFYYAKYKDIKDIETKRYPLSGEGQLTFNVAGETIVQQGKHQTIQSNSFAMDYIMDIREKDEIVDYIFYERPNKAELKKTGQSAMLQKLSKPEVTVKPALRNALVPFFVVASVVYALVVLFVMVMREEMVSFAWVILGLLTFVNLVLFLIIYLPIKMTTYYMDGYRVLVKYGVIFRYQKSVIYEKIDFIGSSQGFFNKVFHNGNVMVNTVGSSKTELLIKNVAKYIDVHNRLKERYEKR